MSETTWNIKKLQLFIKKEAQRPLSNADMIFSCYLIPTNTEPITAFNIISPDNRPLVTAFFPVSVQSVRCSSRDFLLKPVQKNTSENCKAYHITTQSDKGFFPHNFRFK